MIRCRKKEISNQKNLWMYQRNRRRREIKKRWRIFFDLSKLLQQLEDGNPEVREKAIIVLDDYAWIIQKFYEVPGKLEELLNDQSPKVRASAAYAIGKYAEGGLVDRIIRFWFLCFACCGFRLICE
ncbi:MAG: HEAT repeat domain-containing protein [Candidatus Jordarchaeum sp.]|uniref:HEAT repeat domain-containing protein n=1 Tax=Candidatus Jordarchaeum sp. TaxID=2823881 RepID=UPI00404B471E